MKRLETVFTYKLFLVHLCRHSVYITSCPFPLNLSLSLVILRNRGMPFSESIRSSSSLAIGARGLRTLTSSSIPRPRPRGSSPSSRRRFGAADVVVFEVCGRVVGLEALLSSSRKLKRSSKSSFGRALAVAVCGGVIVLVVYGGRKLCTTCRLLW